MSFSNGHQCHCTCMRMPHGGTGSALTTNVKLCLYFTSKRVNTRICSTTAAHSRTQVIFRITRNVIQGHPSVRGTVNVRMSTRTIDSINASSTFGPLDHSCNNGLSNGRMRNTIVSRLRTRGSGSACRIVTANVNSHRRPLLFTVAATNFVLSKIYCRRHALIDGILSNLRSRSHCFNVVCAVSSTSS